jgi:ketosteroid isomerase-like protein
MPEEPGTTDPVARTHHVIDAFNRADIDAIAGLAGPDAVLEAAGLGLRYEGKAAIRAFLSDWLDAFEDATFELATISNLGTGVVFVVLRQSGRPAGIEIEVHQQEAWVIVWERGLLDRGASYTDITDARAAAEGLARERGQATSENLELVRSIYAQWERGVFSFADWASPDLEYIDADGPVAGSTDRTGATHGLREFLSSWEDFRIVADEYRVLDHGRILVLDRRRGRSRTTGVDIGEMRTEGARVFTILDGRVQTLVVYFDRDGALTDLGLAE